MKHQAKVFFNKKSYSIGFYSTNEQVNQAEAIAKKVKKEKRNSCRIRHIDEAVNEYRGIIGLQPVKRNNVQT